MTHLIPNRGFLFGDGFFETIRIVDGEIPLLHYHLERIERGVKLFQFEPDFDLNEEFLKELIQPDKNQNSVCRISFYRDGGGQYSPEKNNCLFTINYRDIPEKFILPNDFDLLHFIGSLPIQDKSYGFSIIAKPVHNIFSVKTLSSGIYVMYSLEKKQKNTDLLFLKNNEGCILEELNHNYLIVKNQEIYIPEQGIGMVNGVVQQFLIDNYGFLLNESFITEEDFKSAENIVVFNGARGVLRIK